MKTSRREFILIGLTSIIAEAASSDGNRVTRKNPWGIKERKDKEDLTKGNHGRIFECTPEMPAPPKKDAEYANLEYLWDAKERRIIIPNVPAENWGIIITKENEIYQVHASYLKGIEGLEKRYNQERAHPGRNSTWRTQYELELKAYPTEKWNVKMIDTDNNGKPDKFSINCTPQMKARLEKLYEEISREIESKK